MVKNWVNPYYVSYNTTKVVLNVAEYVQNNKKYFVIFCLFFYDVVVFTGNLGVHILTLHYLVGRSYFNTMYMMNI